jgi:hypothetical protein
MLMDFKLLTTAASMVQLSVAAARNGEKYHAMLHACNAGSNVSQFLIEATKEGEKPVLSMTSAEEIEKSFVVSQCEESLTLTENASFEVCNGLVKPFAAMTALPDGSDKMQLGPVAIFAIQKAVELLLRRLLK